MSSPPAAPKSIEEETDARFQAYKARRLAGRIALKHGPSWARTLSQSRLTGAAKVAYRIFFNGEDYLKLEDYENSFICFVRYATYVLKLFPQNRLWKSMTKEQRDHRNLAKKSLDLSDLCVKKMKERIRVEIEYERRIEEAMRIEKAKEKRRAEEAARAASREAEGRASDLYDAIPGRVGEGSAGVGPFIPSAEASEGIIGLLVRVSLKALLLVPGP